VKRRAVALTRLLHLHALVINGEPRDMGKGRELEQQSRQAATTKDDDDLLATPTVQ
jgi:hypothetical protein